MSTTSHKYIDAENLSIEVTNQCDSTCRHCFVRAGLSQAHRLSLALVKKILAEGYLIGYRHLHLTGGEPLLWEGLFDALDFAFDLGYQTVFINTNGALFTESINTRLSGYSGLSFSVSLEGSEKFHNHLRGPGAYCLTMKKIGMALNAGLDLTIFTVVGKTLLADLPDYVDKLYSKFPNIKGLSLIQLIRVTRNEFSLSSELLDPTDFLKLIRMVSLLNLCGHKTEILNNPLAVVVSKQFGVPLIPKVQPLHRNGHLIVMADRTVALSHSIPNHFGKYEPGKIKRVLSSKEYLAAVAPDEIICPSCEYTDLCRENGMIRPSEWFRDMHPDVPFCKRVLDRAL